MFTLRYLLTIAGIGLVLTGCTEITPEVEQVHSKTLAFSMSERIIGNKSDDGDFRTDLSFQELCSFFAGETDFPILEVSFEEDEGLVFLRAHDGQSNIYRLLDLDIPGNLRLTYFGGKCKGTNCLDCTKSGSQCICDDSNGNDDDCGEFSTHRF